MAVWSEINVSSLAEVRRFDADFFKPEYLNVDRKIKSGNFEKLGGFIATLTDYHANGSYETLKSHVSLLDNPDFAYMVRTADLEEEQFSEGVKYISEHAYEYLSKSKVFGGEILINKIGSAGKVYLMPELNRPVSLGMNLFLIRTSKEISTFFLYAYFQSFYGKKSIEKHVTGTVPLTIAKDAVRSVLIPIPNKEIHDLIGQLVKSSFEKKNLSKQLYDSAKSALIKELGLDKLVLDRPKSYETSFSEVISSGRIDSDYFQVHFKQQANHLSMIQSKPLRELVDFQKGIEVGSPAYTSSGKLFVRVSNVKKTGVVTGNSDKYISETLFNSLVSYQPKIGDILLTKDGTVGVCYVVDEPVDGIISGGIMKLSKKDESLPSEYLALVINSPICQFQIDRDCSGALIVHWKPKDIAALKIPILTEDKMAELSDLVNQSKIAKKESEQLLDQAKRMVEELIEGAI
ncbi:restriction endonuclease subunit S [Proteus mirabilis]|nr:restriction endonuclease subunit S [Proteus mirabilis]